MILYAYYLLDINVYKVYQELKFYMIQEIQIADNISCSGNIEDLK